MAAAACSTSITKEEPPTEVLSVYFGWMPRYSASCRVGDQPADPALKMPSTSESAMPASSREFRAASACSWRVDLWGTMPISSDSSAPTMATFLYRAACSRSAWVIAFGGVVRAGLKTPRLHSSSCANGAELREADVFGDVFEG